MTKRASYILAGALFILGSWSFVELFDHGSCGVTIYGAPAPWGAPFFTGCGFVDGFRIVLTVLAVVGAVPIVYGLRLKSSAVPEKATPGN